MSSFETPSLTELINVNKKISRHHKKSDIHLSTLAYITLVFLLGTIIFFTFNYSKSFHDLDENIKNINQRLDIARGQINIIKRSMENLRGKQKEEYDEKIESLINHLNLMFDQ
jgi:uncharacterized protein YoxC